MYASFDRSSPVKLDSTAHCLSWKGNANYGWLALGNSTNTVGVTFTQLNEDTDLSTSDQLPEMTLEKQGMRRNFNFREHTHEVTIVRWNPLLDKVATCDSSGTVIVWRNHNGRSIMELVNNRGSQISDFQWSRDGTKVLITYSDGYVLVGTAFGRRIWARQLNIGSFVTTPANHTQPSNLLSSTWSPDDSRIVVGSSIGELIELDAFHNGSLVSTTEVLPGIGIIGLQWVRIPGFEAQIVKPLSTAGILEDSKEKQNVRLSLYLRNGKVVLMNSCGDQQATIIRTGLIDGQMLWSEDGSMLAVAGLRKSQTISTVRFFQPSGQLLFTLPLGNKDPVTAITWAHDNSKMFVATSNVLHTVSISRCIPSLQQLCQSIVSSSLVNRDNSYDLILPTRFKVALAETFNPIIKGHVPKDNLLEYVSHPPPSSHRVYCTLIPSSSSTSTNNQRSRHPSQYTLYVEHLGNLIPVLEATRRSSKLRPSFTISLPSNISPTDTLPLTPRTQPEATPQETTMDSGDSSTDTQFRCVNADNPEAHNSLNTESGIQLACREDEGEVPKNLPNTCTTEGHTNHSGSGASTRHLVEVSSHIIASKFRIQSLNPNLPNEMGTIIIKTSFLHIQPRKVIVHLPRFEGDSGIDSDSGSEDESDVFMDSELSLDSLSSMEELGESHNNTSRQNDTQVSHSKTFSRSQHMSTNISSESQMMIHSKTPTWNEQHMIYQLDFGGRVTTKSAKNFQLEMGSEQVLQFGRIENGSFILDFQYPFSPIQAFATALSNLV